MTYGFQILNTAGKVLVDSDTLNLGLLAEGTATTPTTTFGVVTITYANTGIVPTIFVKCSNLSYYLQMISIGLTSATFRAYSYYTGGGVALTFDYKVYTPFRYLTTLDAYGLQVFNASSQLVFDSSRKVPFLTNILATSSFTIGSGATASLPSGVGSTPWWCISNVFGIAGVVGGSGTGYQVWYAARVGGGPVFEITASDKASHSGTGSNANYTTSKTIFFANSL